MLTCWFLHLNKSTEHFHALAAQLNYLESMKEPLSENEILLRDFAKSYVFLVQYEIQGMHWNNQQCSLHPAAVYYHKLDQTKSRSPCFISDDLMHDVDFMYMVIKETFAFVKNFILSNLYKVNYFSDVCSG